MVVILIAANLIMGVSFVREETNFPTIVTAITNDTTISRYIFTASF